MDEIYIDASNTVAGRLASKVAKELLKGKNVFVVNAEKVVISGDPTHVVETYTQKTYRGDPYHGPFYPKEPDRMLRRMVRGMVPYKKDNGKRAMERLRVYISVPSELKGKKFTKPKGAENELKCKTTELGELAEKLGVKKRW